jgi:ABC-type multidrug transport system fused ATPase/permease subunit
MSKKIAILLILIFVGNMCLFADFENEIGTGVAALFSGNTGLIIGGAVLLGLVLFVSFYNALAEAEPPADMPRLTSAGEAVLQHTSFGYNPQSKEVFIGFTFHPGEKLNTHTVNHQLSQFGESRYALPGIR